MNQDMNERNGERNVNEPTENLPDFLNCGVLYYVVVVVLVYPLPLQNSSNNEWEWILSSLLLLLCFKMRTRSSLDDTRMSMCVCEWGLKKAKWEWKIKKRMEWEQEKREPGCTVVGRQINLKYTVRAEYIYFEERRNGVAFVAAGVKRKVRTELFFTSLFPLVLPSLSSSVPPASYYSCSFFPSFLNLISFFSSFCAWHRIFAKK